MAQKPYTSDNKEVCGDMRGWGGGGGGAYSFKHH